MTLYPQPIEEFDEVPNIFEDFDLAPTNLKCPSCSERLFSGSKQNGPDDYVNFLVCKVCNHYEEE